MLNAAVEDEQLADRNDTPATAQDLNASFVSLADGAADRGAVLGDAGDDGPIDEDWYRFDVADGQHFTVVMTPLQAATPTFQIYNADGSTLLAQSIESEDGQQIVSSFVEPSDGSAASYLLRVDQPTSP